MIEMYKDYIDLGFKRIDITDVVVFERTGYYGYILSFKLTKESFIEMINTTDIFSHQQGGKSVNNDDYMVSGQRKILELINHPLVKDISEW